MSLLSRVLVFSCPALALAAGANFQSVFEASSTATAVDAAGNVYVTGSTTSRNLPVTQGAFQKTAVPSVCGYITGPKGSQGAPIPCSHAFVAKIDPTGTRLIYATYLGGEQQDWAGSIAVDGSGNVYVAGGTSSNSFPVTPGAWQTKPGDSGSDGFITKLNPDGSGLVFSTYVPGGVPSTIAVDASESVFVAGTAFGSTFPTTAGAIQKLRFAGHEDVFVLKLNSAGGALIYSTLMGGTFADVPTALAIDSAGNAFVGGYTGSVAINAGFTNGEFVPFPTSPGAVNQPQGAAVAFIAKLNPTGTALLYSTVFGGAHESSISAIAVDGDGAVYFAGATNSPDFPLTPGAVRTKFGTGFAGKLSSDGSHFTYTTYLSGTPWRIFVQAGGNAVISGTTNLPDFPTTPNAILPCFPSINPGDSAARTYIVELNSTGTNLLYSTFVDGTIVASDRRGRFYLASYTALLDQIDIFAPIDAGIRCIVNAANFRGNAIAPGEIVSLFGLNIGPEQAAGTVIDSTGKVSATINHTRVLIGGVAAPLLYVSQSQINAVVPFEIAGQTKTTVQVESGGAVNLPPFQVTVTDADPGIFSLDGSGFGQAAVLNQDGTVNSAEHPADQGSIISLFVTGIGAMQPTLSDGFVPSAPTAKPALSVQLPFAGTGEATDLLYVGDAPGLVEGAVQINARVPQVYQKGQVEVGLRVGNISNPVSVIVFIFVQ